LALRDVMQAWGSEHGNIGHRTAIEIGDVFFCRMGGHNERWHYFVVGEAIARMGLAYRVAAIGDVSLCAAATRALEGLYEGETTSYGARLIQVRSPFPPQQGNPVDVSPKALETLLPKVVRERVEFGRGTWLGEFRALTIVRVVPDAIDFDGDFQAQLHSLL